MPFRKRWFSNTLAILTALSSGIYILLQFLPLSNNIETKETGTTICLHLRPPVRKDEFKGAIAGEEIYQVCPGNPTSWDINVNVERTFSFRPAFEKPKFSAIRLLTDFLFYDRNTAGNTGAIPKIFHFIWSDEIIPSAFVEQLKLFKTEHPAWTFHFWTLKSGRQFIKDKEPQLLKLYDHYKRDVDRADALRYVIMYHFGGAYFDLDSKVLKPLDDLINKHECLVGPEPIENAVVIMGMRSLLANSGFMCKPKHAFFRHVVDQLPEYGVIFGGPIFFTKCFSRFFEKYTNVDVVSNNNVMFEITVAPHDYFELHVNTGVDNALKTLCVNNESYVRKYMSECRKPEDRNTPVCRDMFKLIPGGKINVFEACLEWTSHGKDKRQQSTRSYIDHAHYGTYAKPKTLVFRKENNISNILPGITIHR